MAQTRNKKVLLLGIDPGIANLGWAVLELGHCEDHDKVVGLGLILTEKSDKKLNVKVANDDTRRARELSRAVQGILTNNCGIRAVCSEELSLPRNSKTSRQIGISWGVMCGEASRLAIPIFQIPPTALKLSVTGKKTASKIEVQEALTQRYPFIKGMLKGLAPSKWEHPCDALGAIVSSMDTDGIRILRQLTE